MSGKSGNFDVYVGGAAGGPPRPVTRTPADETGPAWSVDGRWIYFVSNQGGSVDLWRVPAEGGDAQQVTRDGGASPAEWDGWLYYTKSEARGGPPGLWRRPVGGGDEVKILDSVSWQDWGLFEKGICFLRRVPPARTALDCYDFATGSIRTVAELEHPPHWGGMSVSPDGRWILYVKTESQSDLMLVENFR
jgi:Tol biopolymer transport system component